MKIQVKILKENKDGSANAQVDFDKAGLETLVQWGLVSMLTEAIDKYKVRPEEDEVIIEKARNLIKENHAPLFTGNLASTKRKSGKTRKTKQKP
jgi:hypothetical protein